MAGPAGRLERAVTGPCEELAALWRWFVGEEASRYSPLYTAIVKAAAADPDVLALVAAAPPESQYPLLILAAVHDLVLAGDLPELAAVYRGEGPVDAAPPLFRAAVLDHRDHLLRVLHERFVQTNECGRTPAIALGLGAVAATAGPPEALVDAGASAGLNLLYDRFHLEVGDLGIWGDPDSPVVCSCAVHGRPPLPVAFVDVPRRVGVDRAPVDLTDPAAARWLLACTWPDTGRLERTRAAIEIAKTSPPDVRTGDLANDVAPLLAELDGSGPVCVVTSWTLVYLDLDQRAAFVDALAAAGRTRPVAWLNLEHPGAAPGIEMAAPPTTSFSAGPSVMGLTVFGAQGVESQRGLAYVHPHGSVLEWVG